MDIKQICNAGGDILDAVADAVNRNDYSGLSRNVNKTVSRVIQDIQTEASKGSYGAPTHQYAKTTYTRKGQAGFDTISRKENSRYDSIYQKASAWKPERKQEQNLTKNQAKSRDCLPEAVTKRPPGRILGPVQLAWGILATSGFGITALVMFIMMAVQGGSVFVVLAAVFSLLTALSVTDIVRGRSKIGLVNRFYRYARLIGSKGFIGIEELAFQTGRQKNEVLRDLKKMMKKHMFPQGRLDQKQTTFMLTQEAYQQYLQAEQARLDSIAAAKEAAAKEEQLQEAQLQDEQTKRILKDGSAYIQMVHACSEQIRKPQMSYKLSKLEAIMRRIFEQVEKAPESADDLHKFMDYYLPTTTKLLQAYIDLDRQEIAGENISATKKEIEDTLDTINEAFEKLLDSLFEDTAWDISSDISVMKTMMAQEGLTGERDFQI